jgi:pimeloyl-ACP methyl ester carboxylesterase
LIAEDPLHFKEVMSVNTAVGIGAAGFDVRSKLDKVSLPFLVLHGTDDVICFPEGNGNCINTTDHLSHERFTRIDGQSA